MQDKALVMASKCAVCRKDIPPGALKCTECDSFQDPWRRSIFMWSGVVGALVGLIPMWSAALSLHKIAFPSRSSVSLQEIVCGPGHISVVVINSGGIAAQLLSPHVRVIKDGSSTDLKLELQMNMKVPANDLVHQRFELRSGQSLPQHPGTGTCSIVVTPRYIDAASHQARPAEGGICPCPG